MAMTRLTSIWSRWGVAIGVVALGTLLTAAYGYGRADGAAHVQVQWDKAQQEQWAGHVAALEQARQETARLVETVQTISKERTDAMAQLVGDYRVLVDGLRVRTPRPAPPVSRADTAPGAGPRVAGGATGLQLYREDSEFLAREAARADEIRLALIACTAQYTAARDRRGPPQ